MGNLKGNFFLLYKNQDSLRQKLKDVLAKYGEVFVTNSDSEATRILNAKIVNLAVVDVDVNEGRGCCEILSTAQDGQIPSFAVSLLDNFDLKRKAVEHGAIKFYHTTEFIEHFAEIADKYLNESEF